MSEVLSLFNLHAKVTLVVTMNVYLLVVMPIILSSCFSIRFKFHGLQIQ